MAQVQADFPDLSQMFGAQSVYPAILGMQRFKQAQQAQNENIQSAQQSRQLDAQKAPAELEAILSQNRHRDAQTQGLGATLGLTQQQTEEKRLQNEVTSSVPLQTRRDAALADYAAKISAKELADDEAKIKILLRTNPVEGQRMWETLHQVKLKKLELEEQAKREAYAADQRRASAREVANIGASSRENVALTKAGASARKADDIIASAKAGKLSMDRAAASLAIMAEFEEDPTMKRKLFAAAQAFETALQKQKQAAAGAVPQIDPSKVPGAPLTQPTLPGPALGVTQTPAPQATTQYTVGQTYKGKTGSYRYKGGDPKDKNSWEKAN